ncbi:MAG TPA: lipoyl(octanoyl) transferase LipB [Gemmatimonadaceae bacterium]|nr:lipoyl(octanoyl) transferase LipB [Gemmatimonadaceae bacterium]
MPRLDVVHLGLRSYGEILELQRAVARARIAGDVDQDVLLLVEHPPVVTLGRTARAANLVATPELLAARGVERFDVERGGDVTFHGPGQLVGYPIIDLATHKKDLHWYLRQLEAALIATLAPWHIPAERNIGLTGVWTAGRKIASIGVHAREWVTWHGFALNVAVDLSYFDLMVPCGISGVVMTSMERETGARIPLGDVAAAAAAALGDVFSLEVYERSEQELTGGQSAAIKADKARP